jgi:heme exporter protein C
MTSDEKSIGDGPALPLWLLCLAPGSMLIALYLIFLWVSTEVTMGIIQRIFYFHVPAAVVSFWAVFVGGIASILYLRTRDARYDDFAVAANESVVVFEAINILMGSIWGKRAWGLWWTWDARLTSAFLLLLIYLSYVIVRQAISIDQRAVVCAVICIFGMADVPMVYMSNRWFRTQHPSPVIGGGENSGIAPDMLVTLIVGTIAMLMLWWCIIRVRSRLEWLRRRVDALNLARYEYESGETRNI